MNQTSGFTRRKFIQTAGGTAVGGWLVFGRGRQAGADTQSANPDMMALRRAVVDTPMDVALHRARVFTDVFGGNESKPWIVRKAIALRRYFETVPLYLRDHDGIAGAISEKAGAMPVMVELGIGENNIYLSERPDRKGYLKDRVPEEICDYWANRNMCGLYRTEILGQPPVKNHGELSGNKAPHYKLISNQGHLCPSYGELLRSGLDGLLLKVRNRRHGEADPEKLSFLESAEHVLTGLSTWSRRYGGFLAEKAKSCDNPGRAAELKEMARICDKVAGRPPETFREALQLIWLAYQAIHIEGHGYSCTPDRLDQLLLPLYEAGCRAGRIDDRGVVRLIENLIVKMYDNSFWGPEHHLTQGFVVGGSTPDGRDMTNKLSWLMIEGAANMALPEPLIWMRWHPAIDQKFFDFCLTRLPHTTCFPMFWNDKVVPEGLMELGVSREDAFNYVPVGCNELGIPGQFYFNPGAHVSYLTAIELALTEGKGYSGRNRGHTGASPVGELKTFDQFTEAVGRFMRNDIERSYAYEMKLLEAQMRWGQTPLTSCFFDGCVEKAQDMTQGTKYKILSCGGTAFANAVDCLAAVREVVYEKKLATLDEVAKACAANFKGHERLRAKLQSAPKHGNDDPRLNDIIRLVERLRDEPMKEICRDPRDGSRFGNCHVVRSSAVTAGRWTPATPDGRLAGTPVANSVAVSAGCERSGPTATLNSVCKLNAVKSWQCAYQVNIRFNAGMMNDPVQREKLRAMLNVYFQKGGQELQVNVVSSATLRAAQKNPDQFRDLVVRVAGFSEFFVNLTPEMQEEIIARAEH